MSDASQVAIRMREVVKTYHGVRALDGLSFEVPRGAICGLVGPNGAGKTTCFGVIGGYLAIKSGEVDVLGLGPFSIAKHAGRIGMTPQDAALESHLRVRVQLAQLARLQGIESSEVEREVDRVLDLVGLSKERAKRIGHLSHGMRRRVTLAQAFIGNPELILLDEPTSGLDPELVAQIRDLIGFLRGDRTVLVSSHVLADLEAVCDHVVFMEKGKTTRDGALADVTRRSEQVAVRVEGDIPDLTDAKARLPQLELSVNKNLIVAQARHASSPQEINAVLLPVLLQAGAQIVEVRTGESLEAAYLQTKR